MIWRTVQVRHEDSCQMAPFTTISNKRQPEPTSIPMTQQHLYKSYFQTIPRPNTPDYSHCDRVSGDQLESCPANSLPSEKTPLPCLLCHCGEFYQAGHNYRHLPHQHRGEGPDIGDLVWHTAITADQDEGGGASLVRTESSLSYNFPQTLKLSSSSARQKVWQANSAQF